MSTRVTSLASRRARQKLVRILFDQTETTTTQQQQQQQQQHSFDKLRSAYLQKLQQIHPDKHHQEKKQDLHNQFVELQEAWDQYERVARIMERTKSSQSDFTMFGVGCSFSDSPTERELRNEITDQACRGWFSSGAIAEQSTTAVEAENDKSSMSLLCDDDDDDDMFVIESETTDSTNTTTDQRPRRFLVDHPTSIRSRK